MQLTPDRIAAVIMALAAAATATYGGVSSNESADLREILRDERTACGATLSQLADSYADQMAIVRDICQR